jgi:hypothetical protein
MTRRLALFASWAAGSASAQPTGERLSHSVYFTIKEKTPAARERLVAACVRYLKPHPGVVFFAAGARAEDLQREVNDLDFDVALHIVFDSKANHDRYQSAELHRRFIDENQQAWSRVRVFDSIVK